MNAAKRTELLLAHGATAHETDELLRYTENAFTGELPPLPLADEPCAVAWSGYADEAERRGVFPVLRERLVQLRFPVAAGMSASPAYAAATRRGEWPGAEVPALELEAPERLRLSLHPTEAGRVAVLEAPHRPDFETLVRALSRRNEPEPVPPSQGACIVGGLVNWHRVAEARAAWERGELDLGPAAGWPEAFAALRGRRELYQDRVVVLSDGPYSGLPAAALGLDDGEWRALSLVIRLEHECAHYFTRRVFGSMRNTLHDEVIADYAGIVAAAGRFRADWFLRFMGLDEPHGASAAGRMANYRGTPPLSDGSWQVLGRVVRAAARNLEAWDAGLTPEHRTAAGRAAVLAALARAGIEALASPSYADALDDAMAPAAC